MISEKERKVLEREDEKISLRGKIGKGITFTDEDFEEFKRLEDLNKQGKLWDKIIIRELDKKHKGDIPAKEVIFLCAIGRLVKNKKPYSFNALILAPSSSGKDHLVASVLKLFPKRDLEIFGRISAKALNYLHTTDIEENYSYNGKMIYLKEIEEEILNNEVMKEFTSGEEELSKVAITKQKGAGVDVKEIRGHPEVFSTTATTIPTEEIRNRFNILGLDVSDEQTELSFLDEEQEYSEIIKKFIASLEQRNIKIPRELFLFMKKVFPKNKVRYRRDFQKLLDFVKAVALFRGKGVAEPEDYNRAKDIFMNAYSTCADIPLKDLDQRIVKALETAGVGLPAKKIYDEIGGIISIQALYPRLSNLVVKEILEEQSERLGGYTSHNYTLSEEYKNKKPFKLPNYEE